VQNTAHLSSIRHLWHYLNIGSTGANLNLVTNMFLKAAFINLLTVGENNKNKL